MKHTHPLLLATAASAAMGLAAPAQAAFNVEAVVAGVFDPGFTPISVDLDEAQPSPVVVQVDAQFTFTPDAGERNFGNAAFDFDLGPGLAPLDFGAGIYNPSTEQFDANGPAPGGLTPIWFANGDSGSNTNNLEDIVATIANGLSETDPRSNLGQGGATLLGSIFVEWDGQTITSIDLANVSFSPVLTNGTFGGSQTAAGDSLPLGSNIPEPGTLALLAMGGLAAAARRRRAA